MEKVYYVVQKGNKQQHLSSLSHGNLVSVAQQNMIVHSGQKLKTSVVLNTSVIEFLGNFEFRNWHAMRGGLMFPDFISEEKLEID